MALDEKAYRRLRDADCVDGITYVQMCLKQYFGTADGIGLAGFGTSGVSPHDVLEIARLNKVGNFVLKAVPQMPMAGGPAGEASVGLVKLLDAYRRKTILLNSSAITDSLAVRKALHDAGIDFVFLKGPIQQGLLYGDHFMKPSGDVDVLVSPASFLKGREVLRSLGYEVASKSRSMWWVRFLGEQHMTRAVPRASTVDLHHRLQQPGSPSPRKLTRFILRKRPVDVAGGQVPFISEADVLLLSCISIAKAIFNREACAGYVCDVRAGTNGMNEADLHVLLDYAEEQGLAGTLLFGVRAADLLLGGGSGALSERARQVMAGIGDSDLRDMVIAPWLPAIKWPQRRAVLWELCDRKPARYVAEAGWAALAELSRRLFERPDNG